MLRKLATHHIPTPDRRFYITSLSTETIVYKVGKIKLLKLENTCIQKAIVITHALKNVDLRTTAKCHLSISKSFHQEVDPPWFLSLKNK